MRCIEISWPSILLCSCPKLVDLLHKLVDSLSNDIAKEHVAVSATTVLLTAGNYRMYTSTDTDP